MKHIRKIFSVGAAFAIMLMINLSIPNQASADGMIILPPPIILDIYTFSDLYTVPMSSIGYLEPTDPTAMLSFSGGFKSLADVTLISAISGVTFSNNLTLDNGPLIVNGSIGFGGGETALGFVSPPRPIPHGDQAYPVLLDNLAAAGFSDPGGLVALGFTVPPRPLPHGYEAYGALGWSSTAVYDNGMMDLSGLSIDVGSFDFLKPGQALALFGATDGFTGMPTLTGADAGSFVVFDPPGAYYIARVVPEPSTILLLGIGLLGLAGIAIMRRRKTAA